MSDEKDEAMQGTGELKQGSKDINAVDAEKLTRLPLDALLYYVLYGDERLARLT